MQLFAPTSVWNAPLAADAPLDPNSDQLMNALSGEVHKEIDGGYGPWINTDSYSVPVYTVGPDVPTHSCEQLVELRSVKRLRFRQG